MASQKNATLSGQIWRSRWCLSGVGIVGFWLLLSVGVHAQTIPDPIIGSSPEHPADTSTRFRWKRLSLAGGFSIQPGRKHWLVDISPMLAYRFAAPKHTRERWAAGIGVIYMHRRDNTGSTPVRQSFYGGRVFTQYGISRWLALRVEGEMLHGKPLAPGTGTTPAAESDTRQWVFNPLAGGGITIPAKGKTGLSLMVLYNFNYTAQPLNRALYPSPWVIRTGVQF